MGAVGERVARAVGKAVLVGSEGLTVGAEGVAVGLGLNIGVGATEGAVVGTAREARPGIERDEKTLFRVLSTALPVKLTVMSASEYTGCSVRLLCSAWLPPADWSYQHVT